jgi:hypothetical protein
MRNIIRLLWLICAPFLAFGLAIASGIGARSVVVGLLALVALLVGTFYVDKFIRMAFRFDMAPWLSSVRNAPYRYAWDGYGLALDTVSSKVSLSSRIGGRVMAKTYPFSDIREWGFEAPGHQQTHTFGNVGLGVATGVAAANVSSVMKAEAETGFWVKTKDVETPRWFVQFGGNPAYPRKAAVVTDLERWMEIFSQHVNRE